MTLFFRHLSMALCLVFSFMGATAYSQQSQLSASATDVMIPGTSTYILSYTAGEPYIVDVNFEITLDPAVIDVSSVTCDLASFSGRPDADNISEANTVCTVDTGTNTVSLRLATNLGFPVLSFPEGVVATLSLPILGSATLPTTPDISIPVGQTGGDTSGSAISISEANFTIVEATIAEGDPGGGPRLVFQDGWE